MHWEQLSLRDADLRLRREFLAPRVAAENMARLMGEVPWRRDCVRVFGRSHPIPRLHQWYGDPDSEYRWSGLNMRPEPWTATLRELRIRVSEAVGHDFNSVLVNLYRDGNDSMGWHADDEPELGEDPTIASLSLGAERELRLRYRRRDAHEDSRTISLPSGSLLVMAGTTQRFWQHSLPKRLRVSAPRINLTFRRII
ncbi:MAG: alpha-ketoglutarate-dependent dioxygenase AlkB [Gammaproteobacteria bacterium]|nr:alpha-ketoglutarate-dependent dioxygenase AlkB [Gammaproteobacteria bacterium]